MRFHAARRMVEHLLFRVASGHEEYTVGTSSSRASQQPERSGHTPSDLSDGWLSQSERDYNPGRNGSSLLVVSEGRTANTPGTAGAVPYSPISVVLARNFFSPWC